MRVAVVLAGMTLFAIAPGSAAAEDIRWWPTQTLPKALVRTENWQRFPAPNGAYQVMVRSVAGLVAKAVNWSCCFTQLAQLCPPAIGYASTTQTGNDWFIEWGGGYYYPDLFAIERPDRRRLLAEHARRTWAMMQKTGTRIIGFNFSRYDTPDALKAYETFAQQTDGLGGILVFQYTPYDAVAGKTFWVKDRVGVEIPVVSPEELLWRIRMQHNPGQTERLMREFPR